jgi:hypothetical protein
MFPKPRIGGCRPNNLLLRQASQELWKELLLYPRLGREPSYALVKLAPNVGDDSGRTNVCKTKGLRVYFAHRNLPTSGVGSSARTSLAAVVKSADHSPILRSRTPSCRFPIVRLKIRPTATAAIGQASAFVISAMKVLQSIR